jgi:hypothetical protein
MSSVSYDLPLHEESVAATVFPALTILATILSVVFLGRQCFGVRLRSGFWPAFFLHFCVTFGLLILQLTNRGIRSDTKTRLFFMTMMMFLWCLCTLDLFCAAATILTQRSFFCVYARLLRSTFDLLVYFSY